MLRASALLACAHVQAIGCRRSSGREATGLFLPEGSLPSAVTAVRYHRTIVNRTARGLSRGRLAWWLSLAFNKWCLTSKRHRF